MTTVHPLKTWLIENGHTQVWFARRAGLDRRYFHQFLTGYRRPNDQLARLLSDLTNGDVSPEMIRLYNKN